MFLTFPNAGGNNGFNAGYNPFMMNGHNSGMINGYGPGMLPNIAAHEASISAYTSHTDNNTLSKNIAPLLLVGAAAVGLIALLKGKPKAIKETTSAIEHLAGKETKAAAEAVGQAARQETNAAVKIAEQAVGQEPKAAAATTGQVAKQESNLAAEAEHEVEFHKGVNAEVEAENMSDCVAELNNDLDVLSKEVGRDISFEEYDKAWDKIYEEGIRTGKRFTADEMEAKIIAELKGAELKGAEMLEEEIPDIKPWIPPVFTRDKKIVDEVTEKTGKQIAQAPIAQAAVQQTKNNGSAFLDQIEARKTEADAQLNTTTVATTPKTKRVKFRPEENVYMPMTPEQAEMVAKHNTDAIAQQAESYTIGGRISPEVIAKLYATK